MDICPGTAVIIILMTRKDFDDIIHNNYRKLYFIAFRIIRNQQEAEDIVQEVFTRMWLMGKKIDEYKDVVALSVTITKNICIDQVRKMKHLNGNIDWSEVNKSYLTPSPHDQMVNTETLEILSGIIANLPDQFRTIVQMKEMKGLSYEEIASQTGMNINSLRVTLSRARRIIREEYLKYNYERRKA